MVERYRIPVAGSGTREDPARPKYFCEDSDVFILYEVTARGVIAQVFFPDGYVPSWAEESDVEHLSPDSPFPTGLPEWLKGPVSVPVPRPPAGPEPKAPVPVISNAEAEEGADTLQESAVQAMAADVAAQVSKSSRSRKRGDGR